MLLIVGDSHTAALRQAYLKERHSGMFLSRHGHIEIAQLGYGYHFLEPFYAAEGNGLAFTQPPAKAVFTKINPNSPSVILPGDPRTFVFMFGFYPSFACEARHWRTHTVASQTAGRHYVSEKAFLAIIKDITREPLAFFERLQSMNVRFSVASCCPVPSSYCGGEPRESMAAGEIATMYNRFRDYVADQLKFRGIVYHLPPQEVYDEHGAMLPMFSRALGDHHANADYGKLMLLKILRETDAHQPSRAA